MVGKIKRARQKIHQDAVKISLGTGQRVEHVEKISVPPSNHITQTRATCADNNPNKPPQGQTFNFPKGIFAGTVIPPEVLVQTLKVLPKPTEEPPAEPPRAGAGEKKQQSKKERMKERRERWLNKISAIKVARVEQAELKRRKATPVVGDMRILADALPELRPFIRAPASKKQKGVVKKKAEPTDFCQMKPVQKRKLLEMETSRFGEAMKDSAFKADPLAAIGEHLRKRLKQEDEQS